MVEVTNLAEEVDALFRKEKSHGYRMYWCITPSLRLIA
jgi:hypothetical protein